jgi:hypothetical protein
MSENSTILPWVKINEVVMSSNSEIILDTHAKTSVAGHGNDVFQLGIFAGIFSAIEQTLEGPLRFFMLPAALMADAVRALFALSTWFKSNNRNLAKTTKVALEVAKLGVIGTAIIGSLIGVAAIAAITPFLFIGAVGLNTLYHAAKAIFHGVKWRTSKGTHAKKHHKEEFLNNLVTTVTGLVVVTAITLLLAVKPELGVFKAVASFGTAAVLGVSALWSAIQGYKFFKNEKAKAAMEKQIGAAADVEKDFSAVKTPTHRITPTPDRHVSSDFKSEISMHHHDLITKMQGIDDVIGDSEQQTYVLNLIEDKIKTLNIERDIGNIFERGKRIEKANVLDQLHDLVKGKDIALLLKGESHIISSVHELLMHLQKTNKIKTVFSSFFSEVGDVQKLFLLADAYVARHPVTLHDPENTLYAYTQDPVLRGDKNAAYEEDGDLNQIPEGFSPFRP